jgi:ADP-heptose:LPS heptosyltransferase
MKRLLIDFAGMGDLIILTPLLRKLAAAGEVDLLTRPYGPGVFDDQPFIHRVFPLAHPNRGRSLCGKLLLGGHRRALGRVLAAQGYDEVVCFEQERELIMSWVDGWRGDVPCRVLDYPEKQADRIGLALKSGGFGLEDVESWPRLEVSPDAADQARHAVAELGARVVGLQVGSGPVNVRLRPRRNAKGLSVEQWAGLITGLLQDCGVDSIVFHGTAQERGYVTPVLAALPADCRARTHDRLGQLTLPEIRAWMTAYHAFVSVDTGPAHMAAALGCPVLVFFGPSDPKAYLMRGPGIVELVEGSASCQYCAGTRRFKDCRDNICMKSITVEQMLAGWQRLVQRVRV